MRKGWPLCMGIGGASLTGTAHGRHLVVCVGFEWRRLEYAGE